MYRNSERKRQADALAAAVDRGVVRYIVSFLIDT
jgi:hypothetical protein